MKRICTTWSCGDYDRYCGLLRVPLQKICPTPTNMTLLKTLYRAKYAKPFPEAKQRLWTSIEVRLYCKIVVGLKRVPKTAATMRALHGLCSAEMRELPAYKRLGVPRAYKRRAMLSRNAMQNKTRSCSPC